MGPAHGGLQGLVQPIQPDVGRDLQGSGDGGLDVFQGDFDRMRPASPTLRIF